MNVTKQLYQWDTGQKLTECTGIYVDYLIGDEVYRVEITDGTCIIPDELLQTSGRYKVWECMADNTLREFAFKVLPRPVPPNYVFTPTEQLTFEGLVQKETNKFNTNAIEKLNAYNANADNRVAEFNLQTEQIQADVSELKSDLSMLETTDIALTADSAWNDSTTTPTPTPITGYTRSKDVIRYLPDAILEVTATGAPYFIYYDSSMTKLGTCRRYSDIPANASWFVFYGPPSTNLTGAKFKIYLPFSYKNRIESIESEISGIESTEKSRLHSDSIELVSDSAWDDSKTTPTPTPITGYTRSKDVIVFNKDAILFTDASPANLSFVYYDDNKEKLGTTTNYSDIPSDAFYFVFYVSKSVTMTEASYSYYARANSVPEGMITEIVLGGTVASKYGTTASLPVATSLSGGYMSAEDKRKLDGLVPADISISGSGVAKNAAAYGFLPSNDGLTNAQNLQSAINGGGTVVIDLAGTYALSRTIKIPSNTTILIGANVYLERTAVSGYYPKYMFINSGIFDGDYSENITIKGLKIIPHGSVSGNPDISAPQLGLRGLVVMAKVNNLVIDGFEVVDHTYSDYGIQVTFFKNAILKNIHIESLKDGVHFGTGDGFALKHCRFLTNDDCIALNAVDYPASNYGTGDIKNGVVEDIRLLSANGTSMTRKRGIFMLSGAWKDWTSGNSYQVYGDYCVNNGRLYQTYGASPSTDALVSTVAPTHESGAETYSDGLTWVMKQAENVGHTANIKNVVFRDIYVEREVGTLFMFSSEHSEYLRSIYPNSNIALNEGITIENVQPLSNDVNNISVLLGTYNPINKIILKDSNFINIDNFIIFANGNNSIPMNTDVNMSFIGNYYGFDAPFFLAAASSNAPNVNASICGSMKGSDFTFRNSVITPNMLSNDLA